MIIAATRKYAKRQMTWFRNQHSFPELNLSSVRDTEEALAQALRLLKISASPASDEDLELLAP